MTESDIPNLSVVEYQGLWGDMVRELIRPTLQSLAEAYTSDPLYPASAGKEPVETYVLQVPGKPTLCIAPDPSAGLVRIYEKIGEFGKWTG